MSFNSRLYLMLTTGSCTLRLKINPRAMMRFQPVCSSTRLQNLSPIFQNSLVSGQVVSDKGWFTVLWWPQSFWYKKFSVVRRN